jgi:hypothetical protein
MRGETGLTRGYRTYAGMPVYAAVPVVEVPALDDFESDDEDEDEEDAEEDDDDFDDAGELLDEEPRLSLR